MRLYFVRHGESEANLAREFSNRGFRHPLTPRGVAQAQVLAARLANHGITRIYTSPLQRAVETAAILAQALEVTVTVNDALQKLVHQCAASLLFIAWLGLIVVRISALDLGLLCFTAPEQG